MPLYGSTWSVVLVFAIAYDKELFSRYYNVLPLLVVNRFLSSK